MNFLNNLKAVENEVVRLRKHRSDLLVEATRIRAVVSTLLERQDTYQGDEAWDAIIFEMETASNNIDCILNRRPEDR